MATDVSTRPMSPEDGVDTKRCRSLSCEVFFIKKFSLKLFVTGSMMGNAVLILRKNRFYTLAEMFVIISPKNNK